MNTTKTTPCSTLEMGPFAPSLEAIERLRPEPNLTLLEKAVFVARLLRGWDDEKYGDWRFSVAVYAVRNEIVGRDSYILLAKAIGVSDPKRAAELGALVRKCDGQNLDTIRTKILKAGGVKKASGTRVKLPSRKLNIRRKTALSLEVEANPRVLA